VKHSLRVALIVDPTGLGHALTSYHLRAEGFSGLLVVKEVLLGKHMVGRIFRAIGGIDNAFSTMTMLATTIAWLFW